VSQPLFDVRLRLHARFHQLLDSLRAAGRFTEPMKPSIRRPWIAIREGE
jgi:hypothetical protein